LSSPDHVKQFARLVDLHVVLWPWSAKIQPPNPQIVIAQNFHAHVRFVILSAALTLPCHRAHTQAPGRDAQSTLLIHPGKPSASNSPYICMHSASDGSRSHSFSKTFCTVRANSRRHSLFVLVYSTISSKDSPYTRALKPAASFWSVLALEWPQQFAFSSKKVLPYRTPSLRIS
jgi:hypothetical protein